MLPSVKIRDIEAEPGEKTFGYVRVFESSTYVADMPIGIVNGSEPGSTLCLTGSVHGGLLYPGIEAVIRTWNEINPKKLKGILLAVPVVNVPSFDLRSPDKSPIDDLNVSSCFPGKLDGTVSQAIAYTLFNDIIAKSNFHIDLRGGNADEIQISFTTWCKTDNKELDDKAASLANIYGTDVVLLTTEADLVDEGNLIKEASKRGVTSIIANVGIGMGRMDEEDVTTHMTGIDNVMKFLKMLEGDPKTRGGRPKIEIQPAYTLYANNQGLFYPQVVCGAVISEGEHIGEIKNLMGDVLEDIHAPVDGIVHAQCTHRYVRAEERLFLMRRLFKEWKQRFFKEWMDQFLEE